VQLSKRGFYPLQRMQEITLQTQLKQKKNTPQMQPTKSSAVNMDS